MFTRLELEAIQFDVLRQSFKLQEMLDGLDNNLSNTIKVTRSDVLQSLAQRKEILDKIQSELER